jgi:7-cyano-7-deazaguanine synthase in queuosine biosynthesis
VKIVCAPQDYDFAAGVSGDLNIILYGHADRPGRGGVGATAKNIIQHRKLQPAARAWDLVSIALSVVAADIALTRNDSPDGWTRELDLHIAVSDPAFWQKQIPLLESQLRFLTTDLWRISFLGNGLLPAPPKAPATPDEDCVVLLSGGLDSFTGAVDLVRGQKKKPYAVSQVAQGDKQKQSYFAAQIGGLSHLQINHNAECPGENERSQRARSIIFLALGALVGSALKRYHDGKDVTLYVCENGFISINPPLTGSRLGSLSTRTTHPYFIRSFQQLLDAAGLRIKIENPYQFRTKGEMLKACADQAFLRKHAHLTTSCGRYARNGYTHCGRCLPCLIRRAAFHAWRVKDRTKYVYADLSRDDDDHSRFDDVRSAAMAIASAKADGLAVWAGPSLSTAILGDAPPYRDVVGRGLDELRRFLRAAGVK